jgi:hypothetical protein
MEKRTTISIVLIVTIVAFVACYTWGVVRMGDERADEPLTYFKDGAVGDRVYLNGKVNSASSSYGVACVNVSLLGEYPRPLQVNIYAREEQGVGAQDTVRALGVKTDSDEMIAYLITLR